MPCCTQCIFIDNNVRKMRIFWIVGNLFPPVWVYSLVLYAYSVTIGLPQSSENVEAHNVLVRAWNAYAGYTITNMAVWAILAYTVHAVSKFSGSGGVTSVSY